jgi:beta-lactamase class A
MTHRDSVVMAEVVEAAVRAFADAVPGRRVAIRALRGPKLAAGFGADEIVPSASLVKLPLAVAVMDAAHGPGSSFALDTLVARRDLGTTSYPSILEVLHPDHELSIAELLGIMLSTSDNPTSQYLLDLVGTNAATAAAERLGAKHTVLAAGFTDDELGARGRANLTTANDMIEIFAGVAAEPRYRPLLVAMRNSMRNVRIPLRLDDDLFVPHKTGSLAGLVNDAGIAYGGHVDLAVAFLTDQQPDTARTSTDIGDCMAAIWAAAGEDAC